ncbi:hypothetical protein [Hymenobacter psychrotolerans]|uniref:Uncharacterized protein n=1 Tax=Hymenobacter psychrotolerans DSM 18569 TaxID=1121959 RepID=A0A1M7BX78_9BACT|nr:hypothetical protein [Hymenobacter psychrotolerans]SHL59476.1 hypothetical protein SAMN02746009_03036 [Hymenobacter psychrotolerans DSM 18569]
MECLFLSPAPRGRRLCLYALPEGIPLYFKHNELSQQPDYQMIWRGAPRAVSEAQARRWVSRVPENPAVFLDYQQPEQPQAGFPTALQSFLSAVAQLAAQLEYGPGSLPTEVLIGEEPA